MSSLQAVYDQIKKKYRPSPAKRGFRKKKPLSQNIHPCVKRVSLFISLRRDRTYVSGSMTVEGALLIPVFLFFFLHLMSAAEMMRLHGKLQAALWNAGNRAALYGGIFEEEAENLPDAGISYVLIHSLVSDCLGHEYLEASPLVHGEKGLNYLRSEYRDQKECVDIVVTYQVKPVLSLFSFSYRRMSNRYYARAWTGYDTVGNSGIKYVYVTSEGEVWHAVPNCSYIYHVVQASTIAQIKSLKNARGSEYKVCDFCKDQPPGEQVYYTRTGERYHMQEDCTAIYKDIRAIVWREDMPYRACSRCANKEENGSW